MKKLCLSVLLSSLIVFSIGYTASAQQYAITEEQYRQAELDNQQNQADMQEYELDSKIAAVEKQEETDSRDASEANNRLFIYVLIGAGILVAIFLISHGIQKPRPKK